MVIETNDGPATTFEQSALAYLRQARAAMLGARDDSKRPSRELSVALTETDTAILWLQHDIQIKTPAQNAQG